MLDLKVLDPAMGSGHFLVTAVDFLSDKVAELVEDAPVVPEWLDGEYASPLVDRVAAVRRDILDRARQSDWVIDEAQLTDQAILRRMVLKRCIYGVDKNPLTVELAKVSLWLHSFTVGAPLSFLDHHLRRGDSLVGMRVLEARGELNRLGGLFAQLRHRRRRGRHRRHAAHRGDVRRRRRGGAGVRLPVPGGRGDDGRPARPARLPVRPALAHRRHEGQGAKVLRVPDRGRAGPPPGRRLQPAGQGPDAFADGDDALGPAFESLWKRRHGPADREGFLHWEVAFPGVWQGWQDAHPAGGFDAVIGNPPWDRIKLQEVEWFATRDRTWRWPRRRRPGGAGIRRLRAKGSPLADEFDAAKRRADRMGQLVRGSGHYPLLGGGDINLYSLFVERAMGLVKPNGFVGLLTPSGIYADKTAAKFFKSVSTVGRVSGLFDFENRKIFFKDVHASFKFCALVFGGEERRFDQTECAFFLHDIRTIDDPDRCFPLAPDDFARVNPNTGTAPVFRTRRDAEITRRIYERHPSWSTAQAAGAPRVARPVCRGCST